jgi:BioD-like phosphotransacetylase family protein
VISKASEKGIPLLLVSTDTFHTTKQVDEMERLLIKDELKKIELLEQLIKENVKVKDIIDIK